MTKPINVIDTSICPKCKKNDSTFLTYDGHKSCMECMECGTRWDI